MANLRLEWLQLDEDGTITGIIGVERLTLEADSHHTLAPPQFKLRRHSQRVAARIVYSSARLYLKTDRPGAADVDMDSGYMFRHGMDANGRPYELSFRWEIQQGEVLYVLFGDPDDSVSYTET